MAIGAFAGYVCAQLGTPIPWLLGPLFALAFLRIGGVDVAVPPPARYVGQWIAGVRTGAHLEARTQKMSWNPSQYLQYEDTRLRPALDLLARVPLEAPRTIVDLGCGAGNVSQWLARRWPDARIVGVDGDAAMLSKARQASAGSEQFTWVEADLGGWRSDARGDLVYSNAALHWLDDHAKLFPRLLGEVASGGALAVQMPDNFRAPSHAVLFDVARSRKWRERLAGHVRAMPVTSPAQYYEWLAPHARTEDVWSTEYLQLLPARADAEHPVVAWMRGSALIPFVGALGEAARAAFVAEYAAVIERAYPRRADGSVLFPFRRMFIVATR